MAPYVRTVKTAPGARAVQIVYSSLPVYAKQSWRRNRQRRL
jgi:hypothetical protein